jgi:hypothetical protein
MLLFFSSERNKRANLSCGPEAFKTPRVSVMTTYICLDMKHMPVATEQTQADGYP